MPNSPSVSIGETAPAEEVKLPFFDRDLSWLSFNERILMEAERPDVPLLDRLKFLAIYSSNLDEFYRVRVPVLLAQSHHNASDQDLLTSIESVVAGHQERYGQALVSGILPALRKHSINLIYGGDIPESLKEQVCHIFYNQIAGLVHVLRLGRNSEFFPENNRIYFAVVLNGGDLFVANIPSDVAGRFHTISDQGQTNVITTDDIVREHIPSLFPHDEIEGIYAFKVTRDAELNLKDEIGSITRKLEKLLARRDHGHATRILYDRTMPEETLSKLCRLMKLKYATRSAGGRYHNLRDLFSFPIKDQKFSYPPQQPVALTVKPGASIYERIDEGDIMVHTPYQRYDLILRFFNESAVDPFVEKIFVTLYRIAADSAIAHALATAARNGKRVTVVVELKARFDEANNMKWSKKMKAAGVKIVYSDDAHKVHAKVALVKRNARGRSAYYGMLSTGNFNETTARLYADHILLTSQESILKDARTLFRLLVNKKKFLSADGSIFNDLIVAPFNLRERFFQLIDREIANARRGRTASITIKLNNLEEESLIEKLYDASSAGVRIQIIVRSICCIVPGIQQISENISVKRIVDRYLEHARVFIFHNSGEEWIFCGSADWMTRNVDRRVEVCFPILDPNIQAEIKSIIDLQWQDTAQAVRIDRELGNIRLGPTRKRKVRCQEAIYQMLGVTTHGQATTS